ncbi:AAA family ATPase [Campylobacter sp. JMF_01 NE2]|uniref:AAA family ATPase n=1 Tax=unclassified Campylobacter TaxID=2593542 RepID=UPI0022E9BF81|nr:MULTISPECIES: AAA family ATPase [unclassified Campylobacter]MDA3053268.1 AAA family ATPase [Campylobacter sp. JMF_03 NE3]MDA3067549.1 AAA family ATPase [Campylobacter sp. JMF_01 NE2]
MRFFKIDDFYYFTSAGLTELQQRYNIELPVKVIGKKQFLDELVSREDIEKVDFISCFLPKDLLPELPDIELIRVPNKFGLLTKEQQERGVNPFEILKSKIGANIYQPSFTFNDYVIDKNSVEFQNLMAQIRMIDVKKQSGLPLKGFFLTGVPGTGKTFFAKCVAGELNRVLIHLNLSIFINATDTFGLLESFFGFFEHNEGKYVVLIDEIEKMLSGNNPKTKQVLGWLLTALNDINEKSLKSEVFFIATANNITDLAVENPELFRKGRFDMSIYLTAPNINKANETFKIYIDKMNRIFAKQTLPYLSQIAYENLKFGREIPLDKNSKASQIVNMFCENETFKSLIDLDYEKLIKNEEILELIKSIKEQYSFKLPVEKLIAVIGSVYRELVTDRNLFAYVPAEIEQMIGELYLLYFFDEQEPNYFTYFEKNYPIQVSMAKGIEIMNSATQNFVRF